MTNSRMPANAAFSGCAGIPSALRDGHAGRAADARSAQPAVAVRVLGEVLLGIVLGVIELGGRQDLARDRAVSRLRNRPLVLFARALRGPPPTSASVLQPPPLLPPDV